MKTIWHESWTTDQKREHLRGRAKKDAQTAITFAEDREWVEVEKALAAMRQALEELWEL